LSGKNLKRDAMRAVPSPEVNVEIWIADLDTIAPNELSELRESLDSAEKTRTEQFRFEPDRGRFVAAHGLLRRVLAQKLEISPAAIEFGKRSNGKPQLVLPNEQGLRFNLSHAGGFALFATAWDREVGVDLESLDGLRSSSEDLSARILSPRELKCWRDSPNDSTRTETLLRAWTRKEAYIKATDETSLDHLPSIEVALETAPVSLGSWTIYDLPAPPRFAAAIAIEKNQSRERA
jgi:4'-phosphopantetheinyl transferase